jgi:FkbM family methyltransferase
VYRRLIDRARAQLHRVRDMLPGSMGRVSFAQEGEDLVLARLFEHQATGIYVDVGAHHPVRFSNTYLLHRRGWRGVNIDAAPGSMAAFEHMRPDDINLEVGITAREETRAFHVFDEPALNTFDSERARSLDRPPYKIVNVCDVRCAPLSNILREHAIGVIDLLSIDAEGFDFEVLQTVDWEVARPKVVITEHFSRDLAELFDSELHVYMTARGYRLTAKTFNSLFYTSASRE